ncbi:hypothetical protein ACHAWF_016630 [Thalassiosira exigua]
MAMDGMDMDTDAFDAADDAAGAAERTWRDVLPTALLAAAGVVIFLLRQRSSSTAALPPVPEDERRRRRERLAAVAGERAAAAAAAATEVRRERKEEVVRGKEQPEGAEKDGVALPRSKERGADMKLDGPVGSEAGDGAGKKVRRGEGHDLSRNDVETSKDKDEPNDVEIANECGGGLLEGSAGEIRPKNKDSDCAGPLARSDEAVLESRSESNKTDSVGEGRGLASSDGMQHGTNNGGHVHVTNIDKNASSNNGNEDERGRGDTGHRERHARAIAKIMAKKTAANDTERTVAKSTNPPVSASSVTLHLILTSCPGAPRLELSVPKDITSATLLCHASQASGVPKAGMRLIFRGRVISTRNDVEGRGALDEYGIVEGSALHVVGKPTQRREGEESNHEAERDGRDLNNDDDDGHSSERGDSEDSDDGSSDEESESSSSEDGESSESEDDESSESEDEVGHFSDAPTHGEVTATIARTTGEGYYHRAAQRGDLDALRDAADLGHTDLLRAPDANGWTCLHEAVRAGQRNVVEYLVRVVRLDARAVTNGGRGRSPLQLALEHHGEGHPVTELLREYLDPTTPSNNPWADGA